MQREYGWAPVIKGRRTQAGPEVIGRRSPHSIVIIGKDSLGEGAMTERETDRPPQSAPANAKPHGSRAPGSTEATGRTGAGWQGGWDFLGRPWWSNKDCHTRGPSLIHGLAARRHSLIHSGPLAGLHPLGAAANQ